MKTKKFILRSAILSATAITLMAFFAECAPKKKDNNGLLLAALLLLGQQRAPGVYITGQLVDKDGNALANRTIRIKGRNENAAVAVAVVTSNPAANTATYTPAGFYREVVSQGTLASSTANQAAQYTAAANTVPTTFNGVNVTAQPSTLYGGGGSNPTTTQRDSECGSDVLATFGSTTNRRVVCDSSTLADAAVAANIQAAVVSNDTDVATITTNAEGNFTNVPFTLPRTGNTFAVSVDGISKARRLRVNRAGTGSLLGTTGNLILKDNTTSDEAEFQIFNLSVEVEYPRNLRTLEGTLAGSVTVSPGERVILQGTVIVPSGVTLTIGAGAQVLGSTSPGGALLVKAGGRLIAEGTSTNPIVFTSEKAVGQRAPGDWQGIIIQGRGIQSLGCPNAGGCTATGEGDTGTFGGTDNSDNSGTLKYVRIEFAGAPFSPGNERNCLSLMGVGSGTTIDYVQCHRGYDDGFEWWGGAVNHKYLVSTANRDDQLDWTDAYIGNIQYAIGHIETTAIAANDDTSRCVEGDGVGSFTCAGSGRSSQGCADPYFANLTCVATNAGVIATSGVNLGRAWSVRRSGAAVLTGAISHAVILGFTGSVECSATSGQQAITRFGDIYTSQAAAACSGGTAFGGNSTSQTVNMTGLNITAPDWTPNTAVTATGNLKTTASVFNISFFDDTNYRGAINVGGAKWWDGWTSFPTN